MDYSKCAVKSVLTFKSFVIWGKVAVFMAGLLVLGKRSQAQFGGAIETMLKQIAALGAYKELCAEGYKIAETGVLAIKTVKGAEFDLHSLYFSSLKQVSPQVVGYLTQTGALKTATNTVVDLRQFGAVVQSSTALQPSERQYAEAITASFTNQVQKDEDMIAMLLADGKTSMSDGERISLLMPLVREIQEQHRSAENYIDQTSLLFRWRGVESNDNATILSFY